MTIFFHISRYEEVFADPEALGEAGWLSEDRHLLVVNRLEKRAVVDQLVAALLAVLSGNTESPATTYDLTHDIDFLFRYPTPLAFMRAVGGSLYRRSGFSAIRQHWENYRSIVQSRAPDPYDCFDWLLSDRTGWAQKTLYLMAGGETAYDNHYRLEDPKVREMITQARAFGYTIGLHPSYNAGWKRALFYLEKSRLEALLDAPVLHSRQHWLRFDWQTTPYLLSDLGITEDASMGYRHRLGFRCGTGFPYHLYDFKSEAPFPWRERPLALMDSAALHEARNLGSTPSVLMEALLQQNSWGTHLSINFHNSNFDPGLATGRELAGFYRARVLGLVDGS